MDKTSKAIGLSPDNLLAMRDELEERWANDYLQRHHTKVDQLDFLVGSWDMTRRSFGLDGAVVKDSSGEMCARYVLDGRVIQEEYRSFLSSGEAFRGGVGLYTYVPSTKQWVTASVDAVIGANNSILSKVGDEIHYESSFEVQGTNVHLRGRWYDITENSYLWAQSASVDGETWFKTFDARFVRRPAE